MGNGGWGMGNWGLGIGPNPQSPIPNPQSPIPNKFLINSKLYIFNFKQNEVYIALNIKN